jgi:Alcohol dehydrogenase GroES-like domain
MTVFWITDCGSWDKRRSKSKLAGELLPRGKTPVSELRRFMKALRFYGSKDLRVEEIPSPKICGPRQVVVKVAWCGICGTDLHEYDRSDFRAKRANPGT